MENTTILGKTDMEQEKTSLFGSRKSTITAAIIVAVLAAATIFTLVANKSKIDANNQVLDRSQVPVAVSVSTADYLPLNGHVSIPGTIEENVEADVSVGISGKIDALRVELGASVRKGQVIGALDTKAKQWSLKSAELSLAKLEKDYKRAQELLAGKASTEVNVADIQFNVENAKIQVEQLKQQIADANIISPISGTVTARNFIAGEFVNPGTSIVKVVDGHTVKAIIFLNERDVYHLSVGQKAAIRADALPNSELSGAIRYISPIGDNNHNYRVELSVVQPSTTRLKAGTFVKVDFQKGTRSDGLQIPKAALVEGMNNPYVYIVNGTKAVVRKVTLGAEVGNNIEVRDGVNKGDKIIVSGQINLYDGCFIERINN